MKFNLFRPILAILILFIPLYPKFPIFSVSHTYVSIRLDDIVIAISILVWLSYQIGHKLPVLKQKITWFFIIYFLCLTTSTITAVLVYQTEPTNILFLHLFRRFQYTSLFFIACQAIKNLKDLKFPYIFLLISSIFISFYGYGQKYFHFPVISTMNSEFSKGQLLEMNVWTRVSSTFAGHYDLAAFYSVALVLILGIIIIQKNNLHKALGLIIWFIGFQILTFTASRISIFAFWGGGMLLLLLLRRYLLIIPLSILVISSFLTSKDLNQRLIATIGSVHLPNINTTKSTNPTAVPTAQIFPTQTTGGKLVTPIPTVVHHGPLEETTPIDVDAGVARSGEIRFNVEWPRAINAFRKNPLSGSGLGSITLATDNDYLRVLGESGLVGFISFGMIIFFFIVKSFPLKHNLTIIFFCGLLTMLANAIFIDVFEASKTAYLFWLMMGIYYQILQLKSSKS